MVRDRCGAGAGVPITHVCMYVRLQMMPKWCQQIGASQSPPTHTYIHVLSALRLRYHTGPSPWTVLGSVHATAPRTIHIPVDDRPMAARGAGSVGPCVPVRYTRAASTTDTPESTRMQVHCTSLPSCWRAMLRAAVLRVLTNTHGEYRSSRGGLPQVCSQVIVRPK